MSSNPLMENPIDLIAFVFLATCFEAFSSFLNMQWPVAPPPALLFFDYFSAE